MDYAAADSLTGQIAIARVYDRALTDKEVLANFQADQKRFLIPPYVAPQPVSSMPVPPALLPGPTPSVRSMKWPYYDMPGQPPWLAETSFAIVGSSPTARASS